MIGFAYQRQAPLTERLPIAGGKLSFNDMRAIATHGNGRVVFGGTVF
jgi:hypothetical protein